ncbi:hypothetical protein SAMN06265220_101270 [Flavobacterium nitrogenifigens]|uniref:Uncharacterized protein n=1 Tax=Flavobacterium nitrogenifigens TaxID=1617283 RepID=A0A521ALY0_9FLAO|nr:hypothetical protein SAMN06265220_101267 [Flavobacterium nitrogenifigens]SMO35817.1 hypothetical protein SAMN06265220_101270 [Flavobacterium nitrogenifigens]
MLRASRAIQTKYIVMRIIFLVFLVIFYGCDNKSKKNISDNSPAPRSL